MLSILASTASVYAGGFVTINCTAQLSDAVDTQVTVTTAWMKNGIILTNSASRVLSDTNLIGNSSLFLSQVIFSPFELGNDDGAYSCEVTVDPGDMFVMSSVSVSSSLSLSARGNA